MTIKTSGWCGCSTNDNKHMLSLGDTNCYGEVMNYFDESGLGWESRKDHDLICTAGRYADACKGWTPGEALPNLIDAALEADCLIENLEEAMAYARKDTLFWLLLINGENPFKYDLDSFV